MIESRVNRAKIMGARKPGVKSDYATDERAEYACWRKETSLDNEGTSR